MASNRKTTQRWLIGASGAAAVAIVALALVLALHHAPTTVTTAGAGSSTAGVGSATTQPGSATTQPGSGQPTTTAGPTSSTLPTGGGAPPPTTPPTTTAGPTVPPPPHFDTPQAAMNYLTAAWNSNNLVNLRHVTTPTARQALVAMHSEAVNLRLNHCTPRPQGDYLCYFDHDFPHGPATTKPGGEGHAVFLAGPARTPGWYMTVFITCG